jgi:ribosomal-protein-alanine N-acetyltransferase
MEFANDRAQLDVEFLIREAKRSDADKILRLLQTAVYRHINVDWYVPGDWLGTAGFVVLSKKPNPVLSQAAKFLGTRERLYGCLAVGSDVESLAWVRVAAAQESPDPQTAMMALMAQVEPYLSNKGLTQLAWLALEEWPRSWFEAMGFYIVSEIETYVKDDTAVIETSASHIQIRPAERHDIPRLLAIEQAAFEPLWQHSEHSLTLAHSQALSFEVALVDEVIVGFQLSARSEAGAHLVRMTIDPELQGKGVGTALLAHALNGYYKIGLRNVSLNTQLDNISSQALYRKFGFRASGYRLPIWLKDLPHE